MDDFNFKLSKATRLIAMHAGLQYAPEEFWEKSIEPYTNLLTLLFIMLLHVCPSRCLVYIYIY